MSRRHRATKRQSTPDSRYNSTLVAHLVATIDPARMTAAQIVTSALDGAEIVHVVAQAFGLPVAGHDKASALGAIEGFLHEEARSGRRCLLIVDEAQNLSISAIEELRMLSNFQLGSHPLLQTLLLGQPEFRQTLLESDELEQLRQRVIATHHLAAMQPREVQAYIEHRLKCVGWKGNPGFDGDVFAGIYEATDGLPRRINQIVNRLLLLGAIDRRSRIDSPMLEQVLGELGDDGAISLVTPKPRVEAIASVRETSSAIDAAKPAGAPAAPAPEDAIDAAQAIALIESALAGRDAQITELQQAVLDLSTAAERGRHGDATEDGELVASLQAQVEAVTDYAANLEARLGEQERLLRHTLTMLIEWIENEEGQRRAA